MVKLKTVNQLVLRYVVGFLLNELSIAAFNPNPQGLTHNSKIPHIPKPPKL